MLNMYTNPMIPEGWNIKSDFKELQYQLHGDILPKGYEIVFSESSDFAEFVDIPDDIQKSAKPGFIFNNPLTGNSLQKGQDGLWRGIKEKAKRFVGKVKNKFKKGKTKKEPIIEPEEDLIPPRDPNKMKRPGEKEEIQQDMKPEISPADAPTIQYYKSSALTGIEHSFYVAKAGISKDPEKATEMAKVTAKDAAKMIAKKTGETPSKIYDKLMKQGEIKGTLKVAKSVVEKLAPLYKDMLDTHYLIAQGAMDKQAAADQTKEALDSMTPITDKLKEIAKELSELDPSLGTPEEILKEFQSEANEKAKELHSQGKDDLLPKDEPGESSKGLDSGWKVDKDDDFEPDGEPISQETFKYGFEDIKNSVTLGTLKYQLSKAVQDVEDAFYVLLSDANDIEKSAAFLKGLGKAQKYDKQDMLTGLKAVIDSMGYNDDPGYYKAKEAYEDIIENLKSLGLEDYVPGTSIDDEDKETDEEKEEREKNYGYMLDPNFRYEPSIKLEDLGVGYKQNIQDRIDRFQTQYIGYLPESYGDATAENLVGVNYYTGSAYSGVNNLARGKAQLRDSNDKFNDYIMGQMDQTLSKMQIQPPEELRRGVGSTKLKKALLYRKPGDIIYDHGYFSASSQEGTAKGFNEDPTGEILFIVKNAQGYFVDAVSQCKGESERIFPRGSAFKIISMKQDGRTLRVEMEHQLSDSEREKYEKQIAAKEGNKKKASEGGKDEGFGAEIPEFIDLLDYAKGKQLGGSTGARLLEINGTKFVVKKGANEEQNRQEQLANAFYNSVGAKTSNSGISTMDGKPVVVSQYIPGKDLGDQPLSSSEDFKRFGEQIIKGHAMDALINNRDVFGMNYDNIRIGENGEVYRIDNGGSFDTKATGGKKPFDGIPLEFFSMLERGGGKEFYFDVPIEKAYESLDILFDNYDAIKKVSEQIKPEKLKGIFYKRLMNLREIKDFYEYCMAVEVSPKEAHQLIKEYTTELYKSDPNSSMSYPQFKKFVKKKIG